MIRSIIHYQIHSINEDQVYKTAPINEDQVYKTALTWGISISMSFGYPFYSTNEGCIRLCLFLKFMISDLSLPKIAILLFLHCIRHRSPKTKHTTTPIMIV